MQVPYCTSVAWSADGATLYTGYTDGKVIFLLELTPDVVKLVLCSGSIWSHSACPLHDDLVALFWCAFLAQAV